MASNKTPKHDFAPAWLKIPSQDNQKSASHSDRIDKSRRRDNYYGAYPPPYQPLQRQRSFDYFYEYDDPRHPPVKQRHNSADEFNGHPYHGYGFYNGYDAFPYQPPYGHPSKYKHPNSSRYGQFNGAHLNGHDGYHPFDPAFDYYQGDPYYNYNRQPAKYRNRGDKDTKTDKNKDKKQESVEKKEQLQDEDFPSLKSEQKTEEDSSTKSNSSSGVWTNPPNVNGYRSHGYSDAGLPSPDSLLKDGRNNNSVYKALVPGKGALARKSSKEVIKVNGTADTNSNGSSAKVIKPAKDSSSKPTPGKESPTSAMEILNTRFITQPKNLVDKKSEFLKALRKENSKNDAEKNWIPKESHDALIQPEDNSLANGMENLKVDDKQVLSSSFEEERRLLKEMGWKEEDSDGYEITEDEKNEFQMLTKLLKQQQNGYTQSLPKPWSPQHTPPYNLNDTLSSTSEDSESDMD